MRACPALFGRLPILLFSKEVREKYKAEIRGVFGSYARGESHRSSDVDVLVHFEESADLLDFVGLALFLEKQLGCKVDVVPQEDIRQELREFILHETLYI